MVGMEYAQFTNQECVLLQLDLDKAYDQITWSFVSQVLKKFGFGPRICNAIYTMGAGGSSVVLFNTFVVGEFQVKRLIWQGCPLAPLLFAACTHPLVALMEAVVAKKEILRLSLPNCEKLMIKLFANDSLLFLKADPQNVRRGLELVQLFAQASGSQCNIEKSQLISLTKSDSFDYAGWTRDVVGKGKIFWHLRAPLGCYTLAKQAFKWVHERIQKKMCKWRYVLLSFHSKIKVLNTFLMSYITFYSPILCLFQRG